MRTFLIIASLIAIAYSARVESDWADLTNAIGINDQKAAEINGHLMQAKSFNNVTSESSDRNQCQDSQPACPNWKWACTDPEWASEIQNICKKTCGSCPGEGNKCAKIPSWMKNALDFNSRIVGGSIAESPIPWQVRVGGCGGTILDEYTILSAAHCRDYSYILAGYISAQSGPQAQRIRVKNVFRHPKFNYFKKRFDYSIVKLREPLIFNSNVKPACLPKSADFNVGNSALASGWGSIKHNENGPYEGKLRYVGLPLLNQCKYSSYTTLCAGSRNDGKGVCTGDSGGPLVVPKSNSDNTAVVIGISSWVTLTKNGDCALSIFAKVSAVLDWIKLYLE